MKSQKCFKVRRHRLLLMSCSSSMIVSIPGRDPLRAAQLIWELDLYHAVFSVLPTGVKASIPPKTLENAPSEALAALSILHVFFSGDNNLPPPHSALLSLIQEDPALKARLNLAGLLFPYLGITYQDGKGKTQSTASAVIRESLKLGTQNHYLDGIPALFAGLPILKNGMQEHQQKAMTRAQLGLLLRNKFIHNPLIGLHWSTSVLFSLVTELVPGYSIKDDRFLREYNPQNQLLPAFVNHLYRRGHFSGYHTIQYIYGENN
jgi:tRNA nucleotidyltransferase (CCA-adding enzyme)